MVQPRDNEYLVQICQVLENRVKVLEGEVQTLKKEVAWLKGDETTQTKVFNPDAGRYSLKNPKE